MPRLLELSSSLVALGSMDEREFGMGDKDELTSTTVVVVESAIIADTIAFVTAMF